MSCPHCRAAALSKAKFCRQCGSRVGMECPACSAVNPSESKFCGECGHPLVQPPPADGYRKTQDADAVETHAGFQGERRHLTILFTDLSGYSRMMEKYDPEDVQALMASIIHSSIRIIETYNGHVERIIGDEILGLFGIPVAHEDDAIRAIKAARDIHNAVMDIAPKGIDRVDPVVMHTGINTGLVVTARTTPVDGAFDLSGDAINLASRLADVARPNEILVGPETYRQAFGFFNFDIKPSMRIKGKSHPISVYAVRNEKDRPMAGQRKLNLYAEHIGRQAEVNQLIAAMKDLEDGRGAIISIIGEAGTGKSRLISEFEKALADQRINWITGYAFAHTQQVPYFPLTGMVRRWLALDGLATGQEMSKGIIRRIGELLGPHAEEIPIIQGLLGQEVQATAGMSPEEWRKRLKSAMLHLLSAIARQAPTVFCMEDIHWADAASFKLFKDIIYNFKDPAILIGTTRPHASLFTSHELETIASIYSEIHLGELSPTETEEMMKSMLDGESLPEDLFRLIQQRAEGNPFYLEELLNALVDSNALEFSDGRWQMNREFKETDIPSTIHGVIASRVDQLDPKDKRILQEAAVIGRAFLYDLLKRISVHGDSVDASLYRLERAGLIQPRALLPEMEFMFKHALIQEVSYGSLLRRERQRVHERIGRTIERIYHDRIAEFDETLAIHFQKSIATDKATDYLIRSGTKALRRCALDESDQYFKTAKAMLEQQHLATPETKKRLLDVVNHWAFVFYYKGLNRQLLELLEHQQNLLENLNDPVREGFHWAWHGCALWHRHRFAEAYDSLTRALELGEKADHANLIGYASTWLSWPCVELGRFDEAIENSERAEALFVDGIVKDTYIYFNGLLARGYAYWQSGDAQRTATIGRRLIKFGQHHGDVRSLVSGHCCLGWQDLIKGDIDGAMARFRQAMEISVDPWYSQFPRLALCYGAISNGKIQDALPLLDQLIAFSDDNGAEFVGEPARFFKGLASITNGQINDSLKTMETLLARWNDAGSRLRYLTCGHVMARVYSLLLRQALQADGRRDAPKTRGLAEKSMHWFQTCIAEAKAVGARAMEGRALLGLGKTMAAMDQPAQAAEILNESIAILTRINAPYYLREAQSAIDSL